MIFPLAEHFQNSSGAEKATWGGERAESKLYWQVPESEQGNKLISLDENKAKISGLT
jgi:hypothetical protein